ncbi:RadC family protein [Olivibacter sp. XZL3]|uniref:JAB domain-containing protein n=1 Tax=Olivibacter sp. XZL3 TaxID=1735116 RepID=UPI001064E710|nr:JAB domain-containing protein [Olivibacter sp. XZL3]
MKTVSENRMFKMTELKVVYKPRVEEELRPKVTDSSTAYRILMNVWDLDTLWYKEDMLAMYLNTEKRVIGFAKIASGSMDCTLADVRIIYAIALKVGATAVIIAHNHPSGNKQPSNADKILTNKIKQAGKFLDVPLIDHLIVTGNGYLSFMDEGLM